MASIAGTEKRHPGRAIDEDRGARSFDDAL
jgi:hypothetical protein